MLKPEDIRNASRVSGFDHVNYAASSNTPRPRPYRARSLGSDPDRWYGPRRSTAGEAAQDYCDYVNRVPIVLPVKPSPKPAPLMLNTARHPRSSTAVNPTKASIRDKKVLDKRPYLGAMQGYVYLIGEAGNDEVVKVGWSKRNAFARLPELQTGNCRLLLGLAEKPGTLKDEYKLHLAYEPDNVLQEWFDVSPELLAEFDITEDEYKLIVRNHGRVVTL